MVKSQTTAITPATHAGRHVVGGEDPLTLPLIGHSSQHSIGGSDAIDIAYKLNDEIFIANDATKPNGSGSTWTLAKSILIAFPPSTIRTYFTLDNSSQSFTLYGQVRKNGVIVGVQRSVYNDINSWSEDISGWADGDTYEIWTRVDGGSGSVSNQRILGNGIIVPFSAVNNDP